MPCFGSWGQDVPFCGSEENSRSIEQRWLLLIVEQLGKWVSASQQKIFYNFLSLFCKQGSECKQRRIFSFFCKQASGQSLGIFSGKKFEPLLQLWWQSMFENSFWNKASSLSSTNCHRFWLLLSLGMKGFQTFSSKAWKGSSEWRGRLQFLNQPRRWNESVKTSPFRLKVDQISRNSGQFPPMTRPTTPHLHWVNRGKKCRHILMPLSGSMIGTESQG